MHSCPFCDELCDCDLDDTWGLPVPALCPHVCGIGFEEDDEFESDFEEYEEFMDFDEEQITNNDH